MTSSFVSSPLAGVDAVASWMPWTGSAHGCDVFLQPTRLRSSFKKRTEAPKRRGSADSLSCLPAVVRRQPASYPDCLPLGRVTAHYLTTSMVLENSGNGRHICLRLIFLLHQGRKRKERKKIHKFLQQLWMLLSIHTRTRTHAHFPPAISYMCKFITVWFPARRRQWSN